MDITPQDTTTQQPISDDQELAKALAGVLPGTEAVAPAPAPVADPMKLEETPVATPAVPTPTDAPSDDNAAPQPEAPASSDLPTPTAPSGDLEGIKKDALLELRPLIDKVTLPSEEKFDTYLMLIRSTDDASLIGPAHTAAQSITDETRRAEALLDIIKEIDYLSHSNTQQ